MGSPLFALIPARFMSSAFSVSLINSSKPRTDMGSQPKHGSRLISRRLHQRGDVGMQPVDVARGS